MQCFLVQETLHLCRAGSPFLTHISYKTPWTLSELSFSTLEKVTIISSMFGIFALFSFLKFYSVEDTGK
jgi:hypothetical protein